jgi:hypothetical protein
MDPKDLDDPKRMDPISSGGVEHLSKIAEKLSRAE